MDVDSGSAAFHADDDLHLHLPVQMPAGKAPVESQAQDKAEASAAGQCDDGRGDASKSVDQRQYRLPLTLPLHRKRRRATSDTTTNSSSQSSSTCTTNSSGSMTTGSPSGGSTTVPSTATGSMVTCSSSQTPATRQQRRKSMMQPSNNSFQKKPANTQATNHAGGAQSNSVAPNRTNENNDDDKGGPVRDKCMRCSITAKKTPMMRKGPDGCRSLCNACGLKWSRHGIY